ncbi:site-specific integrase [Thalassotalea psychrophila]|uniref:Site-specific integrase n=1 Tax=Thalassotalea psychrophila TaxID=3065647 RepID=A0ABY9TYS9_9GAMM|nr:site-specific integrase [Colwelliaceae bacterium SQ149]
MASIKQLKSGNWNVRIRLSGQPLKTKTFPTEQEAINWSTEQESIDKVFSQPTIYELGLKYREARLKGKGSYDDFQWRVLPSLKHFPQPAEYVTPEQIINYRDERLKAMSNDTVLGELTSISRVYKWAKKEFLIKCDNPLADIVFPKPAKARNRVISKEELVLLMNNTSDLMKPIFELAYETAMRRSEIINLCVKDLHLQDRILEVWDGKEGDRLVPLTKRAVSILKGIAKGKRTNDLLFNVKPRSVTQAFRRARRAVGLDSDVRLHQLRHTRCTLVARKGFNNAQIQAVTGHQDLRSVQRYTHLSAHDVVDLI